MTANNADFISYLETLVETTDVECKGIKDIQKVRKAFWDTINSTKKVNSSI
jgi:hypothetical protein